MERKRTNRAGDREGVDECVAQVPGRLPGVGVNSGLDSLMKFVLELDETSSSRTLPIRFIEISGFVP